MTGTYLSRAYLFICQEPPKTLFLTCREFYLIQFVFTCPEICKKYYFDMTNSLNCSLTILIRRVLIYKSFKKHRFFYMKEILPNKKNLLFCDVSTRPEIC